MQEEEEEEEDEEEEFDIEKESQAFLKQLTKSKRLIIEAWG